MQILHIFSVAHINSTDANTSHNSVNSYFFHTEKSGMGEHKMPKNMFPTHIIWHIFEQWE